MAYDRGCGAFAVSWPEGSEVEEGFVGLSRLVVRCSVGNLSRACTNRAIADGRFEHAGLVERVGGDGSS